MKRAVNPRPSFRLPISRLALLLLLLPAGLIVSFFFFRPAAPLKTTSNEELLSPTLRPEIAQNVVDELWIPIDVTNLNSMDPFVLFCRLDFLAQYRNPPKLPMFKDVVDASNCKGDVVKRVLMSDLLLRQAAGLPAVGRNVEVEGQAGARFLTYLQPTGFIFHESRCGSTLLANLLASLPFVRLYSESTPPVALIKHVADCDTEESGLRCSVKEREVRLSWLRTVIAFMGSAMEHHPSLEPHTALFFKFQSVNSRYISVLREAFPHTPWLYLFREPTEVMMSHFAGGPSSAVCLRSQRSPPKAMTEVRAGSAHASSKARSKRNDQPTDRPTDRPTYLRLGVPYKLVAVRASWLGWTCARFQTRSTAPRTSACCARPRLRRSTGQLAHLAWRSSTASLRWRTRSSRRCCRTTSAWRRTRCSSLMLGSSAASTARAGTRRARRWVCSCARERTLREAIHC